MADTVITYVRGSTYISNTPRKKGVATPKAHGLVGEILIGGHRIDAIERMDGMVSMAGDCDYPNSTMYWKNKYESYVLNPWLGKEAERRRPGPGNILFHPAAVPSDLEGCIGVGLLENNKLSSSADLLEFMWTLSGGSYFVKTGQVVITLRVVGKMKRLANCTPWTL